MASFPAGFLTRHNPLQSFLPCSGDLVPIEASQRVCAATRTKIVVDEIQGSSDRDRQGVRVRTSGHEARVQGFEQLGCRSYRRPDYRSTTRESLYSDHAEALVGNCRKHEQVGSSVPIR